MLEGGESIYLQNMVNIMWLNSSGVKWCSCVGVIWAGRWREGKWKRSESLLLCMTLPGRAAVVRHILARAMRSVFVLKQLINVVLSSLLFIQESQGKKRIQQISFALRSRLCCVHSVQQPLTARIIFLINKTWNL